MSKLGHYPDPENKPISYPQSYPQVLDAQGVDFRLMNKVCDSVTFFALGVGVGSTK